MTIEATGSCVLAMLAALNGLLLLLLAVGLRMLMMIMVIVRLRRWRGRVPRGLLLNQRGTGIHVVINWVVRSWRALHIGA